MKRSIAIATLLGVFTSGRMARAEEEEEAPDQFVVAMVGTTVMYRPYGGPMGGPVGDVSPMLGTAWFVTSEVAIEIDAGPTFVGGEYAAFALSPGLVWAFDSIFYAAMRFGVPVDPEPNLVLLPSFGAVYVLDSGLAPYLEIGAASAVAQGAPDFGMVSTAGMLWLF